ncbi:MAG: sigma-70 family RNA polymerase sigma factor [Bacteroidales bacterium]|nr:sigma-70 family RNA polymerase sigma factor [Bacteroidales bacterium]
MELRCNETLTPKAKRDYALVRAAIDTGSQRAYTELLHNYRDSLYMLMYKMVNDPYDAEDLTIEAFDKAFKNLHQYTDDYAFSTWLFKIASNNCVDFLRKKKLHLFTIDRHGEDEDSSYVFEINDDGLNPEEHLFFKEKNEQIRDFVNQLKPHYRELIELRYYEDMSYEEIAQTLNLPLGTVKAKLFRAKEMLHTIMTKNTI